MIGKILQPVICLLLTVLCIAGCDVSEYPKRTPVDVIRISGTTMGTQYSVKIIPPNDGVDTPSLSRDIEQVLANINMLMSTYDPTSELSRFNQAPVGVAFTLSNDTVAVMKMALELSVASHGAFDVTVGPVVNLWGFGPEGRLEREPSDRELALALGQVGYQAMEWQGENQLIKRKPVYVDLSAIAKGYAVDKIAQLLQKKGFSRYLIDIGGELLAGQSKSDTADWQVAVEQPIVGQRAVQRVLSLREMGIATSGDYRNFYELEGRRYSHTIDPRNGLPVKHGLASVSVLHSSVAYADAMATTLMVLGVTDGKVLAGRLGVAAYFIENTESGFAVSSTEALTDYINQSNLW